MELVWTSAMTPEAAITPDGGETALVAASQRGDRDAFGLLVKRHQQRVFRLAGRFFRVREEVEDAAQETFLKAWEKLHTYRAKAPFEHWLTRVCLNCCYARLRRQKATQELDERDLASSPSDPAAGVELEALLARLAPKDRFVLLLLHGEGYSVAEIAERVGWSKANVKVRAHRARRKLKKLLEEGIES